MGVKATLIDIVKRLTKFDKKLGIIINGVDNAYPERVDRFINNSVTAKTSARLMSAYLAGKGYGDDENKIIVNEKKGTTLQKFNSNIANNFAKQRGVWIHINYNLNFGFSSLSVLPYTHCRLGEKDDNKYNGKILVYDNWNGTEGKVDAKKFLVVDVFNPNKKVVESQINKAEGIDNYKGQIWYINLEDDYDYALSTIDPVLFDCDSEAQSSIFKNKSLRKGFFGKTVIITRPLSGELNDYETPELYGQAQSERKAFKETIEDFIGAENTGGALHIEMEFDEEGGLDSAFKVENIKSEIDDKLFAFTEESVFKNILLAFNSIPSGLIRSDDALFGNSGESLKEMKKSYQENTTQERDELEQVIQKLMSNFKDINQTFELIPLIEEEEKQSGERTDAVPEGTTDDEDAIRKKAQASLKGSVGGVQALLQIQQAVKAGQTDNSSALTIIEEIFGIDRVLAQEMLGDVKEETDDSTN